MVNKTLITLAILGLIGSGWFFASLPMLTKEQPGRILALTTGPVRVPAHTKPVDSLRGVATAKMSTTTITVPEDGWITTFSPTWNGVPDNALRFIWLFDLSQKDPYWEDTPRVVFVMSVEKAPDMWFPQGYGYFVKKGTTLMLMGGFGNFGDTDFPAASVSARLILVTAASGKKLGDAYPIFLNAEKASVFIVPARNSYFVKQLPRPFIVPFDGSLVLLGSHGHKFLKEILLTLSGKELWRTSPVHLPDGTNLGNPLYYAPFNGVPVKKGDALDLTEVYSNPTDNPADAMSSMYIQIVPKTNTSTRAH